MKEQQPDSLSQTLCTIAAIIIIAGALGHWLPTHITACAPKCTECGGDGKKVCPACWQTLMASPPTHLTSQQLLDDIARTCNLCNGEGMIECVFCDGRGRVKR